jgi:hypothetical protein
MVDGFPISGQIDPKAFPFLLMDLHRHGATGSLKVDGLAYQKALYFRGGRVLFGSSNDPRDQLGSILIESGKISPEQLEEVNTKVGPGSPLAKVLSESGFVSQRELSEAARAKVERILADVIAYTQGSFEFEDGVLPKGAVDLKLSTERLILSAVLRVSDRAFVLRQLGSLEIVLAPVVGEQARLAEVQAETGSLGQQLDGHRTLKEAAALTRLDEFEAAKIACALLFLGIVETPAREVTAAPDIDLDLALTARMAFDTTPSEPTMHTVEPDPFFVEPVPPEPPPPHRRELEADPASFLPPPPPPPPTAKEEEVVDEEAEEAAEAEGLPPIAPAAPPRFTPPEAPPPLPLVHPTPQAVRTRPQPTPASKEELAALDTLLNPRQHEGPLEPLEKRPTSDWEPRFAPGSARRQGSRKIIPAAIVIVILGIAAAVVVLHPWSRLVALTTRPTPASVAPSTTLAIPSPTLASTDVPPTTVAPVALESPRIASPVAPAPTPTPLPASPPETPRETPRPRPPARKGAGVTLAEARKLLQEGSLEEAAAGFAANLRQAPGSYSIQLLIACSDDTVKKAVHNVSGHELYIVPVSFKGRSCYRLCWGMYEDTSRAASGIRSIPDYFRRGGATPKVLPTSGLLP